MDKNEIDIIDNVVKVLDKVLFLVCSAKEKMVPRVTASFNCHVVTRYVAKHVPGLRVVDGNYYGTCPSLNNPGMWTVSFCSHSWLMTASGKTIIDPYPVGFATPSTVLAVSTRVPEEFLETPYNAAGLYQEEEIIDGMFDLDETLECLDRFEQELQVIIDAT
jgi:hypothetical protein